MGQLNGRWRKMVGILDLTEEGGERFVNYFEIVPFIIGARLIANVKAISDVLTHKALPLASGSEN